MTAGREAPYPEDTDDNIVLDAQDDDWTWRRRIRANPTASRVYRIGVGLVGLVIVVGGLIAVPAPGPGWLIVFVGVSVWASEFEFAQRLLRWGKAKLHAWNQWILASAWWVRIAVGVGTAALVAAIFWALLAWQGFPTWLPEPVANLLDAVPGVEPRS